MCTDLFIAIKKSVNIFKKSVTDHNVVILNANWKTFYTEPFITIYDHITNLNPSRIGMN